MIIQSSQINHVKKINFLSNYDSLTKLPNRSVLTGRLDQAISHANCQDSSINVMFINMDGFKIINDTFGYLQGDEVLKQVSKRLLNVVSKNDTVCRTDSDQFILSLNDYKDKKNLEVTASKIIDVFNKPFVLRGEEYVVTASVGISQYPIDGEDVENLIRFAYMAMHQAKSLGKNQYQICTTKLKKEALETISLTNDLYKAIDRNQLTLHYQPQVNGINEEIVGLEALLRWEHPEFGYVPPFKFIPLAEKTQLILPIGYWVLEKVAEQFKEWQGKGFKPIKIAINFSVYQLNHPDIVEQLKDVLEKTSIPPEFLEVEITESLAMENNQKTKETLQRIKKLGMSLSIDDFGKEYSSFNRLKESPMDQIKIDMSFVQGIGNSVIDEVIVKTLLSLASNLGLGAIAEGVETKEQADFLREASCDELQGYYFHKPMPSREIEKLLTKK